MDESEKRRERLKAMRMAASESGGHSELGNSSDIHQLSNPLLENSPVSQMNPNAPPRFDYYTDPLAAFSSNKRGKVGNQNTQAHATPTRPWNPEMRLTQAPQVQSQFPTDQSMPQQPQGSHHGSGSSNLGILTHHPAHQFQPNYSPDQGIYQARGQYHGSGPRNPEMTPPANQIRPNHSPHQQQMYQPRSPYHSPGPPNYSPHQPMYQNMGPPNYSPRQQSYPARSPQQNNAPYGSPLGMTGRGNFSSPGFRGSPNFGSSQGRGRWSSNSPGGGGSGGAPYNNSGRGRGRSSGLGWQGGNRGAGYHVNVSAEQRPDLYYKKSMVDDPWKFLTPVVRKRLSVTVFSKYSNSPNTAQSSRPKSGGINKNKARFEGVCNESNSEPSLAEYLAAAISEVKKEEEADDDDDKT